MAPSDLSSIASELRAGLTDEMFLYQADFRDRIVTTLTPVVEQLLAEREAFCDAACEQRDALIQRAEQAERRLREIKKLKPQLEQWLARKAGNPTGWMSDGSAHALTQQAEPLLRDLLAQLDASAGTEET